MWAFWRSWTTNGAATLGSRDTTVVRVARAAVPEKPPKPRAVPRATLRNLRKDRSRVAVIQDSRIGESTFDKPLGRR